MEQEMKELLKYSRNSTTNIFMIIFGALIGTCSLLPVTDLVLTYRVLGTALGIGMIAAGVYNISAYHKKVQKLGESGDMTVILSDFRNGKRVIDDKLIVGREWLIGKGTGEFIKISDIGRIYQTVHKTNYVEDGRHITAVTKDSKEHTICYIKLRGKSDDDVNEFFSLIQTRNPEIEFGYDNGKK